MEKLTILIVDDDKTTTSILNHMLYGYTDHILTASNGLEGLELYQTHQPDIILSDINMPHMNGMQQLIIGQAGQVSKDECSYIDNC